MKRKTILPIFFIATTLILASCGVNNKNQSNNVNDNSTTKQEKKASIAEKIKVPSDIKDTGKGNISISTPSGNSENGQVPFVYVDKDTVLDQIGLNARDFDGSKISYILIDGIINSKEQLGDSQSTLTLKEDELKVGTHKVEVIQFDNNRTDGNIVTYKTANYEVKYK